MLSTDAAQFVPETRDGVEGWFFPERDRWIPRIAGGSGEGDPKDEPKDEPKPDPVKDDDEPTDEPAKDDLGEKGKAAIAA